MLPLVAYTDKLSAQPGGSLGVKVSSYGARQYRADLRRIIQGDRNPNGPGFKDQLAADDLCGLRNARHQPIRPGSYVQVVDEAGVLDSLRDFCLVVPVFPTLTGEHERTIVNIGGGHIELLHTTDARVRISLGGSHLELSQPLRMREWTILVASYASATNALHLASIAPDGSILEAAAKSIAVGRARMRQPAVLIGASGAGERCFDGKIDSPILFGTPLTPSEAFSRATLREQLPRNPDLIAYWDFSRDIMSSRIVDSSPHHLHGTIFQCPARAVTGWRWAGETGDFRIRPDLYSAIHFHSDDMTDAGWETDFTVSLPEDIRSGIYAVRLVPDGDEESAYYCVFAVRPKRGVRSAVRTCFLMPTASYLAYANHRLGMDVPGTEIGMGHAVEMDRHHVFLQEHPELGFSFYEVHADGSGVFYSSRNRPVVDMQPGVRGFLGGLGSNVWQFNADTHITGWLDDGNVDFDVITDEDLHKEGLSLLRNYAVVITGTHPEYYSTRMLDAVQGYVDRGGRLMYLGGNGFYWRISYSDAYPGIIECRRSEAGIRPWEPGVGQFHHAFSGEYGGLWRRNGRCSTQLTGLVMSSQGFDVSEPYELTAEASDPSVSFIFEGIDSSAGRRFGAFGLCGGGAAGLEIDRADPALGTPSNVIVLGTSKRHTDIYLMTPEDLLDPTPDMTGTQSEAVRSDMVYFSNARGGAVFSVGSIAWPGAMAWNGYNNEVSRLTRNVLNRFQQRDEDA